MSNETKEKPDEVEELIDVLESGEQVAEQVEAALSRNSKGGDDLLIGQTIASRYTIEKKIGHGGMGVVYLATHRQLNRRVVVKTLKYGVQDDELAATRFEREALGLSQLDHPNIVTIHDFGKEGQMAYLVMEYVEGETLHDRLDRVGFIPFGQWMPLAIQMLDALAQAHSIGVVHRDLKPQNVMLCERHGQSDFVKVLDFGLAKLLSSNDATVTNADAIIGTTAFMAPERMVAKDLVDQRVDIYSLGVLFYTMLAGRRPFVSKDNIEVLYKHVYEDPPLLSEIIPEGQSVPIEIVDFIDRCMAKHPDERPQDAGAALAELSSFVDSASLLSSPQALSASARFYSGNSQLESGPVFDSGVIHTRSQREPSHSGSLSGSLSGSRRLRFPQTGAETLARRQPIEHSQDQGVFLSPIPVEPIDEPHKSSKTPLILGLVALLVVVGGIAAVVLGGGEDPAPAPTEDVGAAVVADTNDEAGAATSKETLAQARELITKEKYAQAKVLLDAAGAKVGSDAELLLEHSELVALLERSRSIESAKALEDSGDVPGALAAWTKIAADDPKDTIAAENRKRLGALVSFELKTKPVATVSLGGEVWGKTPLQRWVEPGEYELQFESDVLGKLTRVVTVTAGEVAKHELNLRSPTGKRRVATRPKAKAPVARAKEEEPPAKEPEKTPAAKRKVKMLMPAAPIDTSSDVGSGGPLEIKK